MLTFKLSLLMPLSVGACKSVVLSLKKKIYLAAPSLSCSTQDL